MLRVSMVLACLIVISGSVGGAEEGPASPWAALAAADADAFCRDIRDIHPGMIDPYAPRFAQRVEDACAAATATARAARSYSDWRATMGTLVGRFRDGHTNIGYVLTPVRRQWPGFLLDGQGGGWVVRRPETHHDVAAAGDPPEGAVFLGCDGQSAEVFLESTLDPAGADWSKLPERIRRAYRAFIVAADDEPTARRCRFDLNGDASETELRWRTIWYTDIVKIVRPYSRRGRSGVIDLEFAADGHAWIRLADVSNETALKALEADMIAKQARLRSAPYVVFDLRGNNGGNSTWGERIASVLWGDEAVEARRLAAQSRQPGEYGKYWRGSKRASEEVANVANKFASRGPDWQPVAKFWSELAQELGSQETDRLVEDECCQPKPGPDRLPPPRYDGRVFVLTDAATYSSGVVVMNRLKSMGAIQVGEASGQNEVWGEAIGPVTLPSGLGTYRVPVSIIRQPRSELGGLPPDIAWPGAMDDDEGIRAWIARLAESDAIPTGAASG